MTNDEIRRRSGFLMRMSLSTVLWMSIGLLLTFLFWGDLWLGGGLIGGDIYTYYMPQKVYYASRLAEGEFPLWNPLSGHGYPLVAESQTGPFSPFHLVFYRLFDVNTAYNLVQLVHYVLAFAFTWLYARRLNLSHLSAGLAALVYTYGWFPPRICLEWAIVGGAWLPAALWCVESYLASRRWRYAMLLVVALALQMLPGHFNLAFITQLVLVLYVPARLWIAADDLPAETLAWRVRHLAMVLAAIAIAFGLTAVQLAPTWELKHASQRTSVGEAYQPGYGHIPVWYLTQVVAPWMWYPYDVDLNAALPPGSAGTNFVEAHLYFGLVPVALLLYGLATRLYGRDRRLVLWLVLGLLGMACTPGWFVPILQHLPGFGFFSGPGRYGIVTTLAAAILAGVSFERVVAKRWPIARRLLVAAVFMLTTADLWVVSRLVTYATIVPDPAVNHLQESEVRRILLRYPTPVRLFSPGLNLPTILGVASTPPYLGIGPKAYFDPQTTMPEPLPFDDPPTREQIEWLRRGGVTHVLSYKPLDPRFWPTRAVWHGYDRFLNPAWGRREPIFLYELKSSRGRVAWKDPRRDGTLRITEYRANRVVIETSATKEGLLILTDLAYPGWEVTVDGRKAEPVVVERMFRGVNVAAGTHEVVWAFRPRSLFLGAVISMATIIGLAAVASVRWRWVVQRRRRESERRPAKTLDQ